MKVLADIPFELDVEVLLKQNHIEEGTDEAMEFQGLVDTVRRTGRPKALFKECFIDKKGVNTISIG